MKISDLSRATGVDVETIRYYEKAGLLPAPAREANGYRSYGGPHLERLAFVRHCRALDMPLADVKRLLDFVGGVRDERGDIDALIAAQLLRVRARLKSLRAMERQLTALRDSCDADHATHECGILHELVAAAHGEACAMSRGGSGAMNLPRGVWASLLAALLFGAGTPLAKLLLAQAGPWLLAALLYLGSGIGLALLRRMQASPPVRLVAGEAKWLAGAVLAGGVAGPVLLMLGLAAMPASSASLLLNAEAVFTALLAWFVFKENVNARVALGMCAIVAGGLVLAWPGRHELAGLAARALRGGGMFRLGPGQQPDAQGLAGRCVVDRHGQGAGGGRRPTWRWRSSWVLRGRRCLWCWPRVWSASPVTAPAWRFSSWDCANWARRARARIFPWRRSSARCLPSRYWASPSRPH